MSSDCLFCKIVAGEIPAEKIYEDDEMLAFRDIQPAAPQHLLLIPKEHIATLSDLQPEQDQLIGRLIRVAGEIAEREGLSAGYRLVGNCREAACQTVFHIHIHLLGGRSFTWPPG